MFATLTGFEKHDGLETGKLCGINSEGLEAAEDLLQEPQVQTGVAGFALHAGAEVRQGQQRAAVQRQWPLDGTEQEELAPRLLQQDDLWTQQQSLTKRNAQDVKQPDLLDSYSSKDNNYIKRC